MPNPHGFQIKEVVPDCSSASTGYSASGTLELERQKVCGLFESP